MNVTVLLFASLSDRAGLRRIELDYQPGDTVRSVCDRLMDAYPALRSFRPSLLYAVNEEYVRPGDSVPPGATLALIPPVSGG
ncbi:MAG: MoaD/ThiS family protein [Dehalococcoidia bacterium]|nr:MoaD/ThiS family protein [Dehalococcoidia bacterium]NUQ56272.1 MoaD/ThiS family protein [Dehalococcoidia bacterium]